MAADSPGTHELMSDYSVQQISRVLFCMAMEKHIQGSSSLLDDFLMVGVTFPYTTPRMSHNRYDWYLSFLLILSSVAAHLISSFVSLMNF